MKTRRRDKPVARSAIARPGQRTQRSDRFADAHRVRDEEEMDRKFRQNWLLINPAIRLQQQLIHGHHSLHAIPCARASPGPDLTAAAALLSTPRVLKRSREE